ncbi:MAG: PAS domain S-box protein [Pseudomonadota bacterium]
MKTTNSKIRIVLGEPDPALAKNFESRLQALGFTLAGTAAAGEEALSLVERLHPDLALLKADLPGGLTGLAAGQAIYHKFGVPVVFLGSPAGPGFPENAGSTLPFIFLPAPFQDQDFKLAAETARYVAAVDRERKDAEETLVRARQEWVDIFQAIGHPTLVLDPEHRILDANRAASSTIGQPLEKLRGNFCFEIMHGTAEPPPSCPMSKSRQTGKPESADIESEILGRTYMVACTPILDREGKLEKVIHVSTDITDRKNAEKELRLAERRYRMLFEEAPAMYITTHNRDGRPIVADCNRSFLQTLGRERREVIDRPLSDFYTPESKRQLLERGGYKKALESILIDAERELVAADGRIVKTLLRAMPEYGLDGTVIGTRAMFLDVTERRRAEEALRESEKNYRELVQNAASAIIRWNRDGNIVYFNEFAQALFGYGLEEAVGRPVSIIVPNTESTGKDLGTLVQDIAAHPEKYQNNINENICRDGRRVWMAWTNRPTLDERGQLLEILAIGTDITLLKKIEQELKESEEKFRRLFEAESDAILLLETETDGLLEANPAAVRLFGYNRDELLALKAAHLTAGPGTTPDRDLLYRKKDGTVFPVEISESSFSWKDIPVRLVAVRDIGPRIKAREEKEKLENQYRQAQKMEAVGRLAGGVAHDFNNMLSVIIGNTELVMMDLKGDKRLHDILEEVVKAAERSAALTRQLLAFARKQAVKPKILDLNETVSHTLKMLQRLIGEDIDLLWKPGPVVWPIKIDPAQVDQILANLAVNARDAISGVGALTIKTKNMAFDDAYVAAHPGLMPGEFVLLTLSDTGAGIDREHLPHVFEPFFTTKEEGKGTGLGLATVYGIIKQNNGFVNVHSEVGEGTTIRVYFPRAAAAPPEPSPPEPTRSPRGSETLLLVEDEPAILKLAKSILEIHGYRVYAANSPNEAIFLADMIRDGPRLLLTDVVMPEMNGRDLRDILLKSHPTLRTLFMSGHTADVLTHLGVMENDINLLPKPFSVRSLTAKVREVLDA